MTYSFIKFFAVMYGPDDYEQFVVCMDEIESCKVYDRICAIPNFKDIV